MNYFIGINGGGTKTSYIVTDSGLNTIFSSSTSACNLKKTGIDAALKILEEIINDILLNAKIKIKDISGIGAGFAGAGRSNDAEGLRLKFNELIESKYHLNIPVVITTDIMITLEGAFNGDEGAVLISGTGSIIYAKDKRNIYYRAGGFGRIIGDEGSGYTIGKKGLAAAAKYFDSRGKENKPVKYLKENFNVCSSEELIIKVYEENFEPSEFAPFVIMGAEENDETCKKIIDEEAEELVLHIKAVKNYFKNKIKLSLSGGVVAADNYFSKLVKEKIALRFPNVEVVDPLYPPEIGAILFLKKKSEL
jgi:N-acetylglucosamine kinase-like BadF-type ATPase